MPKVTSSTVSLWEILNTSIPYMIPYNQRPYTWEVKHWEALWNSFFSQNDISTFLGSFIFLVDKDNKKKDIQIFDGQQRITTLHIMCKSFIDVLHANKSDVEAADIRSYLMVDHKSIPRLKVSKNIKEYFLNNIQPKVTDPAKQGVSHDEKNIFKAYSYFYKLAAELLINNDKDGSKIYSLFTDRLSDIEVVRMTITDIVLGIELFETVNATGKQLNASDLAKNALIKQAQISDNHEIETIDTTWSDINDRLVKTGFTFIDFMHYYWISKYKPVGKNQLFAAMKTKFGGEPDKWMNFLTDLDQSSKTFENIFTSYTFELFVIHYPKAFSNKNYSESYLRYLQCLSYIKNKSWIIPIFTLLDYETKINKLGRTYIGNKKFHSLLRKHFVFSFLHFNVFSFPTRDYTPAMYKLSKEINDAFDGNPQDIDKANAEINKCFQKHFTAKDGYVNQTVSKFKESVDEFNEGILEIRHTDSNKYLIHNLFGEIEESIFDGTFHNVQKCSIEHYMPQEAEAAWGIPKEVSKIHENRLGNILIIDAGLNGKLQNKSHNEKLAILKSHSSNSNFTKEFIAENESDTGKYDFGKITKSQLEKSDPIESPSEIDLRSIEIGKYIRKIYVDDFKY